jgi:hypothetical protein
MLGYNKCWDAGINNQRSEVGDRKSGNELGGGAVGKEEVEKVGRKVEMSRRSDVKKVIS